MAFSWVAAQTRQKTAMPHKAQATPRGAPSCSNARPTTAGGAIKMKAAGRKRSGHGPTVARRTMINTNTAGQNIRPTPNWALAQAPWPSCTPASGASTLPTMGINSAGVTPTHSRPPAWLPRHQRATTHPVAVSCPKLPSHHSARAAGLAPSSATATVASSKSETGMAATNGWRTG